MLRGVFPMRMDSRHLLAVVAAALLFGGCTPDITYFQPSATSGGLGQCDAVNHGIDFRAYLPDKRRYVFVSVIALSGTRPSVAIVVDKNYDGDRHIKSLADKKQLADWWIDRSRPFLFSTDRIDVTWEDGGRTSQIIPGLVARSGHFEGTGNDNVNSYAFYIEVPLPGFDADEFDVAVPAVSFDGVTVTPPLVHFTRMTTTTLQPLHC
jgi:hypothetical protein